MPAPTPSVHALDLTGVNINNKVIGEAVTLTTMRLRSIAPLYGPFYTESIIVVDGANSGVLIKNTDYVCLDVIGLPTAQSGKEICAIVLITNAAVSNNVFLTYQTLGGQYEKSYTTAKRLIDTLSADTRPIEWPNVLNRPSTFDPVMHLHQLGDVIGFEYVVASLEQLKQAVLLGDDIGHTEILAYVDARLSILSSLIDGGQGQNIGMAIARAADANTASNAALTAITANEADSSAALTKANTALFNAQALVTNIADSEARARLILGQYSSLFPGT
jgi:hypothetical protein